MEPNPRPGAPTFWAKYFILIPRSSLMPNANGNHPVRRISLDIYAVALALLLALLVRLNLIPPVKW